MRAEGFETVRRILLVFPRYTSTFGTFEHAYPLTDGVKGFMPPQGLLLIAAYLPANWPVRFVDENISPATKEDFGANSIEKSCLLRDPGGKWRLYISYEVGRAYDRNPPDGGGGPNHWEVWLRDPDGYKVVLASPDGTADGGWRPG